MSARVDKLERRGVDKYLSLKMTEEMPQFAIGASENSGNRDILQMYDLHAQGLTELQSVAIDKENKRFIVNKASTVSKALSFADGFDYGDDISIGDCGHTNDACVINGYMWALDGSALSGSKYKCIYKSDMNGVATEYELTIPDNSSATGTKRVIGGICRFLDDDTLLLVSYDYRGNTNAAGDLLVVYTYKISTGAITQVFSTDWVGWFVQGATMIDGYLYVAANLPPQGSTYTGIAVWKIDVVNWQLVDKLIISGVFEPEGLDSLLEDTFPCLYMGVASWQNNIHALLKLRAF